MATQGNEDESLEEEVVTETETETETVSNDDQVADETDASEGDDDQKQHKPKTLEEALAELETTRIQLRKANRQAAERRIKLKELQKGIKPEVKKEEKGTDEKKVEPDAEIVRMKAQLKTLEREKTIGHQLDAMGIGLASAQARTDLVSFVCSEMEEEYDPEEKLDKEDIQDTVKSVLKSRPYLIAPKKKLGETDSKKHGTNDSLVLDEKELAASFGIRPM
jgi:hypothetical protein